MLVTMLDLARRARAEVPGVAAVVDIRSRVFSTDLKSAIAELDAIGAHPYVIFRRPSDRRWFAGSRTSADRTAAGERQGHRRD
jgi:RNase adaptor protein for sRNA GlmZ degradation